MLTNIMSFIIFYPVNVRILSYAFPGMPVERDMTHACESYILFNSFILYWGSTQNDFVLAQEFFITIGKSRSSINA